MPKKNLIKLLVIALIGLILLNIIYWGFFTPNDQPFLENDWVSIKDPVYYHHFSKNELGYTMEVYDKDHDLVSKFGNGVLVKNKLVFESLDQAKDIYTYQDGMIYFSSITKRGVKLDFTPLEKVKYGK